MTLHEQLIREEILGILGRSVPYEAVDLLFNSGLMSIRVCEQRAICAYVDRLILTGTARVAAMRITAEKFCCSYAKVRGAYYNKNKI